MRPHDFITEVVWDLLNRRFTMSKCRTCGWASQVKNESGVYRPVKFPDDCDTHLVEGVLEL